MGLVLCLGLGLGLDLGLTLALGLVLVLDLGLGLGLDLDLGLGQRVRWAPPAARGGVAPLRHDPHVARHRDAAAGRVRAGGGRPARWRRRPEGQREAGAMWGALRGARPPPPPALRRGLAKAAGPRSVRQLREAEEAAPVFQYAGKAAKRKDRVFVWGFSYSGALGVPSFVRPDAGWKKPRRIQSTPYRLETAEKVGGGRLPRGLDFVCSGVGFGLVCVLSLLCFGCSFVFVFYWHGAVHQGDFWYNSSSRQEKKYSCNFIRAIGA